MAVADIAVPFNPPQFNPHRIDLPLYRSKRDLKERISLAIQMESTGFDIE